MKLPSAHNIHLRPRYVVMSILTIIVMVVIILALVHTPPPASHQEKPRTPASPVSVSTPTATVTQTTHPSATASPKTGIQSLKPLKDKSLNRTLWHQAKPVFRLYGSLGSKEGAANVIAKLSHYVPKQVTNRLTKQWQGADATGVYITVEGIVPGGAAVNPQGQVVIGAIIQQRYKFPDSQAELHNLGVMMTLEKRGTTWHIIQIVDHKADL